MDVQRHRFWLAGLTLALTLAACGTRGPTSPSDTKVVDGVPGGPGTPELVFTTVPEYGETGNLKGKALHVKPEEYKVAVFIRVEGGWWTKPTFAQPTLAIDKSGSWSGSVTTGGADVTATDIKAYLIPTAFAPPSVSGSATIPTSIEAAAVAALSVSRTPKLRTIRWSGYEWQIKNGFGTRLGPGPNYFSDESSQVFVDSQGWLHLKIAKRNGVWTCSEVVLNQSLGYGRYMFELASGFETMDQNAVLGLFTWDTAAPPSYREMDIEFSRWGVAGNQNGQFVVQPYSLSSNIVRFNAPPSATSAHSFAWTPTGVDFQSQGSGYNQAWTYSGANTPTPGNENARINLWLFNSVAPAQDVEVIVRGFSFSRATLQ